MMNSRKMLTRENKQTSSDVLFGTYRRCKFDARTTRLRLTHFTAGRAVSTCIKQQRCSRAVMRKPLDMADEEHMIATGMHRLDAAFEMRRRSLEQWHAAGALSKCQPDELVGRARAESARKIDLIDAQNVNGKVAAPFERRKAGRNAIERPHHQRWIKRQ